MHDQLTKSDIQKMKEEIEYRKLVVRKEALEAVKEARAHGDLSENFEYHAAKKDKNINESRIRYLERMNNTVEIYFEDEDETETFKLVTTVRGNSLAGKISTESPIGKAVLGHKVGDRVFVKVGESGGYYVQIRALDKTSDDSDALRKF